MTLSSIANKAAHLLALWRSREICNVVWLDRPPSSLVHVLCNDDVFIGANIGTHLSDMPRPTQAVALLKARRIRHVRLYDTDRTMLVALLTAEIKGEPCYEPDDVTAHAI
ncbi:hypothetical protein DVH24_033859 [Malus domestica]|uniref:Uncharacterized protein n=1 Tax=Malus domestica TaxID=3750 RepID=A0A498KU29_MALDO|nr:hypothetical protein DVH24_033859 [Malus domestica]